MAILTFKQYLEDVGGAARDLQIAKDRLAGKLSQHNSADFSTLVDADFTGMPVTKEEYDSLMVTINDLINIWWIAGHGTNIEAYLVERPS